MRPAFASFRGARPVLLWLLASLFGACESDAKTPEGIVVAVYTDLAVRSELTSLTASVIGGDAEHTFTFTNAPANGGSNFLVSFGVQRGQSGTMRLKLTGYGPNEAGPPIPVIEHTLKARFIRGKTGVLQALLSRNCLGELSCGEESTCDPLLGMCAVLADSPVQLRDGANTEKIAWLPAGYSLIPPNPSGPDGGDDSDAGELPDSGNDAGDGDASMPSVCKTGDAKCPAECGFAQDQDCLRPPGEACALAEQCVSQSCVGNYCCETACSDNHVAPSCQGGSCQAGICEERYGDCNDDKAQDGCETSLAADPVNCGACGRKCPYGVCLNSGCASSREGSSVKESFYVFAAGAVHAFRITSEHSGKLASLGILIQKPNDGQVRFALFEDGVIGLNTPYPRLAHSEALNMDNSEVAEWIIPEGERPDIVEGKRYWLYFTFSKATTVYASSAPYDFWASTDTPEFGPIEEERPNDEYTTVAEGGLQFPSAFFTVVPSKSPTW